ncbi:hypothetical protein [Maritimibacter sp. DP1N21-5]|uniref:hypothetical protein n=1 Tax=Maritimibacter sp. DP1N21-5 TaxID=2836867 RepID=UPI001C464EB0|nr:hypothetical protein [Maritimibacter sp. DP1N21-5]MBV7408319.1 hypothetical protein [Maritimibacter sp. DP1N21-5]
MSVVRLFPLAFALLSACDSPSPQFMDAERREVTVQGSTFSVYRIGDHVEVIRTSPERLPRVSVTMAKAAIAVHQATGCPMKAGSMTGDTAVMKAELQCKD